MRYLALCLLVIVPTLALGATAEKPLPGRTIVRWDFASSAEGWQPAHNVQAPLPIKDGRLIVAATAGDPYIEGPALAQPLEGDESQFVAIRARPRKGGVAEIFWALEGEGYAAGREVAFEMKAGEMRTYTIFPAWQGRIAAIRFDPADQRGEQVEVDWIAIGVVPSSPAPPEPIWDFTKGLEGWLPQANVAEFSTGKGGLAISGEGSPVLISPRIDLPADQARFLALRMQTSGVRRVIAHFTTADKTKLETGRFLILPVRPGQEDWAVVDTSGTPGWEGRITRLRLQFEADAPAPQISLRAARLGPRVSDDWALKVDLVNPPGIAFLGESREVRVRVQNVGGKTTGAPLFVMLGGAPRPSRLGEGRTWRLLRTDPLATTGPLEPGQTWEGPVTLRPDRVGLQTLAVEAELPIGAWHSPPTPLLVTRRPQTLADSPHRVTGYETTHGDLWLANPRLAVCAVKNDFGYGPVLLFRHAGGGWRQVGALAPPQLATGDTPLFRFPQRGTIERNGEPALVLSDPSWQGKQGPEGTISTRISIGAAGTIEVRSTFTPDEPTPLTLFRPLTVLAGEGSFGAGFREGLFGGLEYLAAGERSSSTLDGWPPVDLRIAPHPHRITIPVMAVSSDQGDVVALLWRNPPDVRTAGPAAAFAAPNFLDGTANTLMSLSQPAIPEYVDENSLLAAKPLPLKAGQVVTVRAAIYLGGSGEVLDAVRAWFGRYGMPALPALARSYRQELAFCLRGYEQTARRPGKGWLAGKGWTDTPGRNPAIATHYVLGERILGKDAPYPNLTARALAEMGDSRDLDLAVHAGRLADGLTALRTHAYGLMAGQGEDGGWTFQPSEKLEFLGKRGESELGLGAGRVAAILRAARVLQDPVLLAAGRKGLAWMQTFRIPRAAQVWEVPVHTPDMLASAQAVDAFLEGYLATGDKTYLKHAVYWGETGLPFHYFWQADEPGVEAMNGGCIPVLGSTFYTGPWFGRLVQWCGLEYAASLLPLAQYDRSYPWRHIAEAITRSAMTQQLKEREYYGLFPDSVGMVDKAISWGATISPVRICQNVLTLMGYHPLAQVQTVSLGPQDMSNAPAPVKAHAATASLVYGGDLSVVKATPDSLTLDLRYPAGYSSYLGLVGVAGRATVTADGKPLEAGLDGASGMEYRRDLALLTVKVTHGAAPVRLVISNLWAARPAASTTRWTFKDGPEGWQALASLEPLRVRGGVLLAAITGEDPYLGVSITGVDTARFSRVRVRMRAARDAGAQLYFASAVPMSEATVINFPAQADWQEYVLDLRANPNWRGPLVQLRLDPPGEPGDVVEIDEVELLP